MSSDSNEKTPWEDTLILAFRDMQWMKLQNLHIERFLAECGQEALGLTTNLAALLARTGTPPPLLAKLDGRAETASADTLTAINERFFLLEFKASEAKLSDEEDKFMYLLMKSVVPTRDHVFTALSRRGHFVVYPDFPNGTPPAKQGFLPVHKSRLKTQPYLDALHGKQFDLELITPANADQVLWDSSRGLSIYEMAAYLKALCETHSGESARHPMKAIIATPNGLIWPIADLSQLVLLAEHFQVKALPDEFSQLKESLNATVEKLKAHIAQEKKNAKVEPTKKRKPSTSEHTPGSRG
ncbi:hypothetical protein JYG34_09810 [Pseudomonas entomophila]|uniref:hypothetical protein n=1 Tax=Pseudomonas entomophila TaxID=312306 RepID=UPI001BCEC001|nr:hypothetical protein [Pseudomonas entomophila]QVM93281.1 hypothetical protein JYG34_09810 [Pseudomonas entomophila]